MDDKKKIFVYGAGISGQGVAEVLAQKGSAVILYNDDKKGPESTAWLKAFEARGGEYVQDTDPEPYLEQCHLFIISPGIPFTTETVKKARDLKMESSPKRKKPAGCTKATGAP